MKNKGFTLIELMIVVAIIGVIASVVLPILTTNSSSGFAGPSASASYQPTAYERCLGGIRIVQNPDGSTYQLKDASGNGIKC